MHKQIFYFEFLYQRKPMSMTSEESLLNYPIITIEQEEGIEWIEIRFCDSIGIFSCGKSKGECEWQNDTKNLQSQMTLCLVK